MIYPPAADRRNGKHDRDDQNAFMYPRPQRRRQARPAKTGEYDKFATFNFLDKWRPDEKE